MKLFLLIRDPDDVDYDECAAKLIRAKTEFQAREIANKNIGDESAMWTDKDKVRCVVITSKGEPEIILADFNAG